MTIHLEWDVTSVWFWIGNILSSSQLRKTCVAPFCIAGVVAIPTWNAEKGQSPTAAFANGHVSKIIWQGLLNSLGFTSTLKEYNMCVCIQSSQVRMWCVQHPPPYTSCTILYWWSGRKWDGLYCDSLQSVPNRLGHCQHPPSSRGSRLVTGAPATAHLKTSLPCHSWRSLMIYVIRSHSQFPGTSYIIYLW